MTTLATLPDEGTRPAEQASLTWINEGSGRSITGIRKRHADDPNYQRGLVDVARLYERAVNGNRRALLDFEEAMTTSDFSLLFADILDRQVLGSYQDWPSTWQMYARRGTVRDFRSVKRFALDGASATLDEVPERGEYPEAAVVPSSYTYQVTKRGRRLDWTWEMRVNDDLDAFRELPLILGRAARMTEDKFVTGLYAGASGPNSTFFSVGHANVISGNPVLSVDALEDAMTTLAAQRDSDGNPIFIDNLVLVVPPALEVVANNILNAVQIDAASGGGDGTGNNQLRVNNWLARRVKVVVNPWLPIVSATANGNTAWYLLGQTMAGRPAMEVGFLRGHEQPEVFVKAPDSMRVGGGMAPVEDGDFETDAIRHKVRHVLGGTLMDYKMAVASNGSGS
ncbi:phage major capsid protein [Actinomadura litoris]|uniref:phage major capsid protein n=1 Tax=Actinomadura litoris TaxID=2678616 RepID=UPI001FA6DF75|nr:Mu-like prophage major head subunit gpT family protein [Actinomadura litoris]